MAIRDKHATQWLEKMSNSPFFRNTPTEMQKTPIFTLVSLMFFPAVLFGQKMHEVYQLDYISFRANGNHPLAVAQYWEDIGFTVVHKLLSGEYPDMKNRDQVVKQLTELYGRDANELMHKQIFDKLNRSRQSRSELHDEFKSVSKRAKRVFELLGPEVAKEILLEKLFHQLKYSGERETLLTHIEIEAFRTELGITKHQQAKIQETKKQVETEFKKSIAVPRAKIRIAVDKGWALLLDSLSEKESELVKTVVGQPVAWYDELLPRFQRHTKFRNRNSSIPACIWGSELPFEPDEEGKYMDEYSAQELENSGVVRVDIFLVELLSQKFNQEVLELNESQLGKLNSVLETHKRYSIGEFKDSQLRIAELEAANPIAYPKGIVDILNSEQLETLRWLEYQARNGFNTFGRATSLIPKGHPANNIQYISLLRKALRELRTF